MNLPMVTIGMTCYNAEDTIIRAVNSALNQDWPNLEVVIVDDNSSDGSVIAAKKVIANDRRARLIRSKKNNGPSGSRNIILKAAKGEFIAFFDDDDESLANRVSDQINTLLAYEKNFETTLVACYAGGVRRYANGYSKLLPAIGSRGSKIPNGPKLVDYLLLYRKQTDWFYGSGVPACSLMARKTTFTAVGGFDENLRRVEDNDFAIRLAMRGGHFIGTKKSLFVQYATNADDKSPEINLEAEQQLAVKNKAYLKSINRYYYALHWPKLRYWHFKRRYDCFIVQLILLIIRNPISVSKHLLTTGPHRLRHEGRMRWKASP